MLLRRRSLVLGAPTYQKRSKRSCLALQIGQTPGGRSRAQRYPQTRQRHTGIEGASPPACLTASGDSV